MKQLKITKSITDRADPSLDRYLTEIGKEAQISPDEEVELAKRIREGDHEALDKLTKSNLRFVVSVAKQYQNQGLGLADLINEGNMGLIRAAKKFDETRGFKFISYAVWWIRQSIMQAIAEQARLVRMPANQLAALSKIHKVVAKFEQENERRPSVSELSRILNIPKEKLNDALSVARYHQSTDTPVANDEEAQSVLDLAEFSDLPNIDKKFFEESLDKEIQRTLATLTERERYIVKLYFGIQVKELSLDEIADLLGLTRERVRQIKEKAIRRLRFNSKNKLLRSYLGY